MARYIGGNLSYGERLERYLRRLRTLPVMDARWPWQCRCGTLGYVRYRGRYYCPRCGRRWEHPD
jgi:hypothetical protein